MILLGKPNEPNLTSPTRLHKLILFWLCTDPPSSNLAGRQNKSLDKSAPTLSLCFL